MRTLIESAGNKEAITDKRLVALLPRIRTIISLLFTSFPFSFSVASWPKIVEQNNKSKEIHADEVGVNFLRIKMQLSGLDRIGEGNGTESTEIPTQLLQKMWPSIALEDGRGRIRKNRRKLHVLAAVVIGVMSFVTGAAGQNLARRVIAPRSKRECSMAESHKIRCRANSCEIRRTAGSYVRETCLAQPRPLQANHCHQNGRPSRFPQAALG